MYQSKPIFFIMITMLYFIIQSDAFRLVSSMQNLKTKVCYKKKKEKYVFIHTNGK